MITLYQFPVALGLPVSVSPFCTKVETYLRLTGHPYETACTVPFKSPNKKLPFVAFPDGTKQAESGHIIAALEAQGAHGAPLDADVDPEAAAALEPLVARAEDSVYFACLYARFVDPAGWRHQRGVVKQIVPSLLAPILCPLIRRGTAKTCVKNGFADDGGYAAANDVLDALAAELGDNPYFLGDTIRTVDCALFAQIMQVAYSLNDNPARARARSHANLMAYVERVATAAKLDLPARAG